jgi:hypothetical protein
MNGGQIQHYMDITNITNANPAVVTTDGTHRFMNGQVVTITDVGGMTEVNGNDYIVANSAPTTFELQGINSIGYGAYTSGGEAGGPYQITNPYSEAQMPAVKFVQSADVMYLAHQGLPPKKLSRTAHDNWTIATVSFTAQPPEWAASDYPGAVGFFEERLYYAGSPSYPQTFWGSMSGDYENFTTGAGDDNSVKFTISAGKINPILWLASGKTLYLGTGGGEWTASGQTAAEAITPDNILVRQQSYNGSVAIQPLLVESDVLFVQKPGKKLKEWTYSYLDAAFKAKDHTITAEHLTTIYNFEELAYAPQPDSVIWATRADGTLLAFTFMKDQEVFGWARHQTGTTDEFESIATIPGTEEDEVWVTVKRTVNEVTVRHIERLDLSFNDENTDNAFFVDSGLSYNDAAVVSGITQAAQGVVTATAHGFSDGDEVQFFGVEGMIELNYVKVEVSDKAANTFKMKDSEGSYIDTSGFAGYTGSGTAEKTASVFYGLNHLEGETVAILADGAVQPNKTVSGAGSSSLTGTASRVSAGLPYNSDLETLRVEAAESPGAIQGKLKRIIDLAIRFYKTLGGYFGDSQDNLEEIFTRDDSDVFGRPPALKSEDYEADAVSGWERDGHIFIRQSYPLPMTILGLYADVEVEK